MKYISIILANLKRFKYAIIIFIGVIYVGLIDSNSWLVRYENKVRQDNIKKEIERYDELHANNMKILKAISKDPEAMKKIAREKYFMKEENEDIFVLSDDKQNR